MALLQQGATNRRVAETEMNEKSSRSHSVFTCTLESKTTDDYGSTHLRFSRLHLVDLAGSERQKSSGAQGERLREASSINKSLSTLGLVIMSLVDRQHGKARHIPYRWAGRSAVAVARPGCCGRRPYSGTQLDRTGQPACTHLQLPLRWVVLPPPFPQGLPPHLSAPGQPGRQCQDLPGGRHQPSSGQHGGDAVHAPLRRCVRGALSVGAAVVLVTLAGYPKGWHRLFKTLLSFRPAMQTMQSASRTRWGGHSCLCWCLMVGSRQQPGLKLTLRIHRHACRPWSMRTWGMQRRCGARSNG